MRRIARTAVWTVFVVGATLVASAVVTGGVSRPLRYELPAGYGVWILVQYADPRCGPLLADGLSEVLVVADTGRACTSSPPRTGLHDVEYTMRTAEGVRHIDPSVVTLKSLTAACSREQFYVRRSEQQSIPPIPDDWTFCKGFPAP